MKIYKYTYNKHYFKNIDTEEKAYWLGFLFADGCINEKPKSKVLEIILAEEDKEHLNKFIYAIEGNQEPKLKQVKLNGKTYNSYRLSICCTELCNDLIKLGCLPRKSLILEFPKYSLPLNLYKHFIRGYVDGDGSISTRSRVSIVGTENFLNDIQDHFINELGLTKINLNSKKGTNAKQYEKGNVQGKKILKYLYKDSNIYLDRKYNKALAYLQGDL